MHTTQRQSFPLVEAAQTTFPHTAKLAQQYLSTPESSVYSEKFFRRLDISSKISRKTSSKGWQEVPFLASQPWTPLSCEKLLFGTLLTFRITFQFVLLPLILFFVVFTLL